MKRVLTFLFFTNLLFFSFVHSEGVIYGDFTTPQEVYGDLVIVDGSVRINSGGDLVVHGDLKITGGSIFMDEFSAGKLKVFGDLIVTNTKPNGNASVIVHNSIFVTGAIILSSKHGEARLTTTNDLGDPFGGITAESIVTKGYGKSHIKAGEINTIRTIETNSKDSDAYVWSEDNSVKGSNLYTNAGGHGYIYAGNIFMTGVVSTNAVDDAYVNADDALEAGKIFTRSIDGDASVKATNGAAPYIDVKGPIRMYSENLDATLYSDGNLDAGAIFAQAYRDARVIADDSIRVLGEIATRAETEHAHIYSLGGLISANNITTHADGNAYVKAYDSIKVDRNIETYSENYAAYVYTDGNMEGEALRALRCYKIVTNGKGDSSVKSMSSTIKTDGPIYTKSRNGDASIYADENIEAESIVTRGVTSSRVFADSGNLKVEDVIDTKSTTGDAHVKANNNISARSIKTFGDTSAYVESFYSNIEVAGDISTKSPSGPAYVKCPDGDLSARSIRVESGIDNADILPEAGTGKFMYIPNKENENIEIKDSIFNLDRDYVWNTQLTLKGNCEINGNGHKLTFGNSGGIISGSGATVKIRNLSIDNVGGDVIRFEDAASIIELYDVKLTQSDDTFFKKGTLRAYGEVSVDGPGKSFLQEGQTSIAIRKNSDLKFGHGVTFKYDAPSQWMLGFDQESRLIFDEASFHALDDVELIKGKVVFDNTVTFSAYAGKKIYLRTVYQPIMLEHHLRSKFIAHGDIENNPYMPA